MRVNHLISETAFPRTYLIAGLYFYQGGGKQGKLKKKKTNGFTEILYRRIKPMTSAQPQMPR